jgi:hypothetical protein
MDGRRGRVAADVQSCDSTCYWCGRWFFQWMRDRMFAIQRSTGGRSGDGAFADAAATSIRAPRDHQAPRA